MSTYGDKFDVANIGSVDGSRALRILHMLGVEALPLVRREVTAFGLDVLGLAKRNARIKTGRLRRSIHAETFEDGAQITGVVGTNVEYAARFEHGFDGVEDVRSFTRRQTMAFGHPITPRIVSVKAFTRHAKTKASPFLQPAVDAVTPPLAERIGAALTKLSGASK